MFERFRQSCISCNFLLICVVSALTASSLVQAQEPIHEGKTLTQWQETLKSPDASLRWQAVEALGKLGQQFPRLVVKPLSQAAQDQDLDVRLQAIAGLTTLKQFSETAVPAMQPLLKDQDSDLRRQTALALSAVGPFAEESVPSLGKAVRDPNANVRLAAISALQSIGPDASRAMDDLLAALQDKVPSVRRAAVSALYTIAPHSEPARIQRTLPVLIAALADNDPEVRRRAATTLGALGNRAESAVEALAESSRSVSNPCRQEAARALGQIAGKAIQLLITNLQHGNATVRTEAILALESLGYQARPAFADLTKLLADPDPNVRARVRLALRACDPEPKDALAILKKSTGNQADLADRVWAVTWLGQIAAQIDKRAASEAVGLLTVALADENAQVRQSAVNSLGALGADAKPTLPKLCKLIEDPDAKVRLQTALALGRIDQQAALETIPILIKALADAGRRSRSGPPINQSAAAALAALGEVTPLVQALEKSTDEATTAGLTYALVNMGPKAKSAFKYLQTALQSRDAGTRQRSAEAMQAILPDAKDAVPVLVESLRHEDDYIRRWATAFLSQLGIRSPSRDVNVALGPLTQALQTETTTDVRVLLIRTIGDVCAHQIEPPPPSMEQEILRVLIVRLNDINPEVRRESTTSLGRIGAAWRSRRPIREAIPTLLDSLTKGRPYLGEAANALGQIGDVPLLVEAMKGSKSERIRAGAAHAIAIIGPKAYQHAPALIAACQDSEPHVRHEAVLALGAIGRHATEAVPALIKALEDSDHIVPPAAAFSLGLLGPEAVQATAALGKALGAHSQAVRNRAQAALVAIGPDSVAILREQLKSAEPNTVTLAVQALRQIGLKARVAIPDLISTFARPEWEVKYAVAEALTVLQARSPEAVPALTLAVSNNDVYLAMNAVSLLREQKANSESVVKALIVQLEQRRKNAELTDLQILIICTLGDIGPQALSAVPVLLVTLDDVSLVKDSANALRRILNPIASGPELVKQLRSTGRLDDRQLALVLGSADKGVTPALLELLGHKRARVRYAAASSLTQLKVEASTASTTLIKSIDDGNRQVRLRAVDAILELSNAPAKEILTAMTSYLQHWDPQTRVKVAIAMTQVATREQAQLSSLLDSAPLVKVLLDSLRENPQAYQSVLNALAALAKKGVNLHLEKELPTEDNFLSERILNALGSIVESQSLEAIVDSLTKSLQDRHLSTRRQAAESLSRLASLKNVELKRLLQKSLVGLDTSITERDRSVRLFAALANWRITLESKKALPVLLGELAFQQYQDFDLINQIKAEQADRVIFVELVKMAERDEQVRTKLFEALGHESDAVRLGAIVVIGSMKSPPTARLAQGLAHLQVDFNPVIRRWSMIGLRAFSGAELQQEPAVLRRITDGFKDRDLNVRYEAIVTFGKLVPNLMNPKIDEVLVLMEDPNNAIRHLALETAGRFGESAKPAISALQHAIKNHDPGVRRAAIHSLGQIGIEAIPVLKTALTDNDFDIRVHAAKALGRIGSAAQEALSALRTAAKDRDQDVADAVLEAIKSISQSK